MLVAALLAFTVLGTSPAAEKKKTVEPFGQVGVTVFREPGFALSGAEVTLAPIPADPQIKVKGLKGVCDVRGELVFRVPTAAARYTVRAISKGYSPQDKTVSIEGEQRIDVTFLLAPESK